MAVDFYALLEVPEDASQEEIKSAFRDKVQDYHPDHNDDPRAKAQFTALKKAYDTLGDPVERNAYDRMGHANYVSKRLSGLPDPETWAPAEADDGGTSTGATASAGTGGSSRSRSSGSSTTPGGTSGAGSATSSGSSSTSGSRGGRSASSNASDSTASGTASTGSSANASTGSSTATGTQTTASGASASGTATGAGGGGGSSRASTTGTARRTNSDAGGGGSVAYADDPIVDWISRHDWARRVMGWPLLWVVTLLYAAGVAAFVGFHAEAMLDLAERVSRAGADTGALSTALERQSIPTVYDGTLGAVAAGGSEPSAIVPGVLLAVGGVVLPPVVFVLVYLTRLSPGWHPTYLYAVLVLGPVAGLAAGAVTSVSLAIELALFVGLPFGGLLLMVSSAFLRPRLVSALS